MIDTTKDIFWLIAAISLGVFTFFICWTMYYLIMMLRDMHKVIGSIKQKIDLVDKVLQMIKEKLEKTSSHFTLMADTIMKVAGFFLERQPQRKKKKTE